MADSQRGDTFGSVLASDPGPWVNIYIGHGSLRQGEAETPCEFEVGQLSTGQVVLLYSLTGDISAALRARLFIANDTAELSLRGESTDGFRVEATGLRDTLYLPQSPVNAPGEWDTLQAKQVTVRANRVAKATRVRFGLTNLDFMGIEPRRGPVLSRRLPLSLRSGDTITRLGLEHAPDHVWKVRRVQSLRCTDVTAEVSTAMPSDGNTDPLTQVLDDLCHILSLARGSRIQWIYQSEYDARGKLVSRSHLGHATAPYAPLALVGPRDDAGRATKVFVETAYPQYVAKREAYRLDKGTIQAYLEAKAENDCIETRSVKLAVAIEALKAVFLDQPECSCSEFIVDVDTFRKLCKELRTTIKEACPDAEHRKALYGNLSGLNRRSFGEILQELCESVGLEAEEDIPMFVRCRNSLIHRGEFYHTAATPDEREKHPQHASIFHEWLFIVNFLDKVFLKLLGYSGPYTDWSQPNNPVRSDRV